jgi:hypothetical protein
LAWPLIITTHIRSGPLLSSPLVSKKSKIVVFASFKTGHSFDQLAPALCIHSDEREHASNFNPSLQSCDQSPATKKLTLRPQWQSTAHPNQFQPIQRSLINPEFCSKKLDCTFKQPLATTSAKSWLESLT